LNADVYDAQTYEPRKGVGYLLHRVRMEMLAAIDRELAAEPDLASLEATSAQFLILASVYLHGARSASDLCKSMQYDAGAMTRMIDRLENKGLLRRSRCPDDRRLVYLEKTDQGAEALPRMKAVAMRVLNRLLRGFTKAEARQLEGFLSRMLENASDA